MEEIEVEHGSNDIALNTGPIEAFLIDDALLQQGLRLLDVLLVGSTGEEAPLKFLLSVMQLYDDQAIDVLRVIDFLRIR